jgi:AAA domain
MTKAPVKKAATNGNGSTFKPAVRENIVPFIGLAGGTGSGKTKSALRLARGLVGKDGKIAAADTEGRRMSYYASHEQFDVTDVLPPFRPEVFRKLAEDAEAGGYGCLIIDSFSHEWSGDGGVVEWHEEELQRFAGDDEKARDKNNMRAWIKPKAEHKHMINSFLQRRIPIIFCFRAEEKVKPRTGGGIEQLGWQPIGDSRFMYELTTLITLSNEAPGVVNYKLPRKINEDHLGYFPDGQLITEEAGVKLAAWARGAPDKVTDGVTKLLARIKEQKTVKAVNEIMQEEQVLKQVQYLLKNRPGEHARLFDVKNSHALFLKNQGATG